MNPSNRNSIFVSSMGWSGGLRLLGLPLQFLVFLLVARLHTIEEVGVFAIVNAIWLSAKGLGPLGLDIAALRFGGELLAAGREAEVGAVERRSVGIVLLVNCGFAIALAVLSLTAGRLAPRVSGVGFLIAALGIPVFALLGLQVSQLRARNLIRAAQLPESVLLNVASGLLIAGSWIVGRRGIEWALTSILVSAGFVVALNAWQFARLHRGPRIGVDPALGKSLRVAAVHMFIGQALTTIGARIAPILVGVVVGTGAAGLFEAASRLGQLASLSTWAAGVAVAPLFAAANATGDRRQLQKLVDVSSWAAFLPALLVLLVIAVAGRYVLDLFGEQFRSGYTTALLVGAATAINAAGGMSSTLLYMAGKGRVVVYLTATGVAALVAITSLLSPVLGVAAAGFALIVSALVRDGIASLMLPRMVAVRAGISTFAGLRIAASELRIRRPRPGGESDDK